MTTDATVIIPTDLETARTAITAHVDAFGDHLAAAAEHRATLAQLATITGDLMVPATNEQEKRSLIEAARSCNDPMDYEPRPLGKAYRMEPKHVDLAMGLIESFCDDGSLKKECISLVAFEVPNGCGFGVKRFVGNVAETSLASSEFMLGLYIEGGRVLCIETTLDGKRNVTTGKEWEASTGVMAVATIEKVKLS